MDILEHYDVFAGGKKGKPTTTSKSFHIRVNKVNTIPVVTQIFSLRVDYLR